MRHLKTFENYNNVEITQSGGIFCDNPDCGWGDETIKVEDYKDWVNKPCPDCGESVLTQDDFDKTNKFMDAINVINSIPPDELEKMTKNMSTDDIIDAYLKLKEFGFKHNDDDGDKWTFENLKIKDVYSLEVGKKYKIIYPNYDDFDEGLEPEEEIIEVVKKNRYEFIVKNLESDDTHSINITILKDCDVEEII